METLSILPPREHPQDAHVLRSVLPIRLPPATLRPVAFRVFTKKHDLTLTSSALNLLADFVGKKCGSAWRETGLAEKILDEAAKAWKGASTAVIVEGTAPLFSDVLKSLDLRFHNGRVDAEAEPHKSIHGEALRRSDTPASETQVSAILGQEIRRQCDPRQWLAFVNAFEQPRLVFNPGTNQFQKVSKRSSVFPEPSAKTNHFRSQYALVHHRLLRSMSSQAERPTGPTSHESVKSAPRSSITNPYRLTAIANMLGRGGTRHILLGLLVQSTTGSLAISDLSGSVSLDLDKATPVPADGSWFAPGMFVIVEGIYLGEESGTMLGGKEGVGGTIGGKFLGLSIGGPPCERREITLGSVEPKGDASGWSEPSGAGFGWVDFLGLGSERTTGSRMRSQEKELLQLRTEDGDRTRIVVLGEMNLKNPKTLQAFRKIMGYYAQGDTPGLPMAFILAGNFAPHAVLASDENGSRAAYIDLFESLALVLSEFPDVLRGARFIFLPGDRDPWESAFSGGAAAPLPRKPIPEMFTTKIRKTFSTANADVGKSRASEVQRDAIWTTNPSRLGFLGSVHEMVLFRDDLLARMRRGAIRPNTLKTPHSHKSAAKTEELPRALEKHQQPEETAPDEDAAEAESSTAASEQPSRANGAKSDLEVSRKLVKTLLDQGNLSPFPPHKRPVLWDSADALRLFPLPTALFLVDPEAPTFAVTYEGCHVMNPGRLVPDGQRNLTKWIEYDALTRRSQTLEKAF